MLDKQTNCVGDQRQTHGHQALQCWVDVLCCSGVGSNWDIQNVVVGRYCMLYIVRQIFIIFMNLSSLANKMVNGISCSIEMNHADSQSEWCTVAMPTLVGIGSSMPLSLEHWITYNRQ